MNPLFITALILSLSNNAFAKPPMDHSAHSKHSSMSHSTVKKHVKNSPQSNMASPLKEAGNDAFGTIQEVITILSNDPKTDWKKVNLERLRRHLLDMQDMTSNVDVLSQKPIKNGLVAIIRATTPRAHQAFKRIFKAHPNVLKQESGWDMRVAFKNGQYHLTTTTKNPAEVDKIRGLGYIGLMAYGKHHQPHHLAMAKGSNPHSKHQH